jgi:lantibiotic transport system permease protein
MWLAGNMMLLEFHSNSADLFPYAYPAFSIFPKHKNKLPIIQISSIVYTVFFLVIGFLDFKRRRIKA